MIQFVRVYTSYIVKVTPLSHHEPRRPPAPIRRIGARAFNFGRADTATRVQSDCVPAARPDTTMALLALLGATLPALLLAAAPPAAGAGRSDSDSNSPLSLAGLELESLLSFELGGLPSAGFLRDWQKTSRTFPLRAANHYGGAAAPGTRAGSSRTRTRTVYFEPQPCAGWDCPSNQGAPLGEPGCSMQGGQGCATFGMQLIIEKTDYHGVRGAAAASEWVVTFRNTNPTRPSLPLCGVRTLNASFGLTAVDNLTITFRDSCGVMDPEHPLSACAHGPIAPPAKLITARKLACTASGGCAPNPYHPQLAAFPPGSRYRLGGGDSNASLGNNGNPSGPNGGLPLWEAWTTAPRAAGGGNKTRFGGLTISVGWTGHWTGQLLRSADTGGLQIEAGQSDFCAAVPPGEAYTFPRVLVVEWAGDHEQLGVNAHRRIVADYKIPRDPRTGTPLGMLTSSNGMQGVGTWKVFDEATQLFHLKAVQASGIEALWMDASWFKHGFGPSGNWHLPAESLENNTAFPGGLGVIGRAAHAAPHDTKFIVWFEPERVTSGSYIAEHFPAQVLGLDIDVGGGTLADLGDERMRELIVEYVTACVEEYELDVYRIDFNMPALQSWRAADARRCPPPPSPAYRTCPAVKEQKAGFDVPNFDLCELQMTATSSEAGQQQCAAACCADPRCAKFVYADPNPPTYRVHPSAQGPPTNVSTACGGHQLCEGAAPCCYLKAYGPSFYRKGGGDHAHLVAGSVLKRDEQPDFARYCGGMTENKYVAGLYKYWDAVRAASPGLVIDNCAGGGTRVDLESVARTVYLWRNDADNAGFGADPQGPLYQQADTMGFTQFAPVNGGQIKHWVLPPGDAVAETPLDPYWWRGSSLTAGGIGSDEEWCAWLLARPSRTATLRAAVQERQSLRFLAIDGDYYIHSPALGGAPADLSAVDAWAVWQLHDPDTGSGAVTLLRRPNASSTYTLALRGPLTATDYVVHLAHGFDNGTEQVLTAAALERMTVTLPPASSLVVRYSPVGGPSPGPPGPGPPPAPPPPPPPPAPAPAPSPAPAPGCKKTVVFGDAYVQLALCEATLEISNLTATRGGRVQGFVSDDTAGRASLWLLNATNCSGRFLPNGAQVDATSQADSRTHAVASTAAGAKTLVLRWLGVRGLPGSVAVDVTMNVSLSTAQPGRLTFSATVVKSHPGGAALCIQTLALPNLPSLVLRSPADTIFRPQAFGTLSGIGDGFVTPNDNLNVHMGDSRPALGPNGGKAAMQWMALYTSHPSSGPSTAPPIGLYIATHDPHGYLSLLLVHGRYPNATDRGQPTGLRWLHLNPDLADGSGVYTLPYEVVIESFSGDWFDGAQIYRDWALAEASWTRAGNLSARAGAGGAHGIADWLVNTPLWLEGAGTGAGGVASFNTGVLNALELKNLGYFWNWWMKTTPQTPGGECFLNPNNTASDPSGFAAAAATMKAAGVHAFPYIEGRVMDRALTSFLTENASQFSCIGAATEFYGKTFAVMDPATLYWQTKMANYMDKIATLAPGIAGLYVDQVTGACALACRGQAAGHPAGGGTSWVDGNRQMFARSKAALTGSRAVVSESNGEVYLSAVDGYLALYGWANCGAVPAFQAVYGGYSLNIGAEYQSVMTGDAINRGVILTDDYSALMATQLAWGSVLGGDSFNNYYASLFFANKTNEPIRAYTADLAAKRLAWAEYLVHGRLLRPPVLLNTTLAPGRLARTVPCAANPKVMTACELSQPVMQLWEAGGGGRKIAVVAVNYNLTESVTFAATVDVSALFGSGGGAMDKDQPGHATVKSRMRMRAASADENTVVAGGDADSDHGWERQEVGWVGGDGGGGAVRRPFVTVEKTIAPLTAVLIELTTLG
jgi:hypothetical protein